MSTICTRAFANTHLRGSRNSAWQHRPCDDTTEGGCGTFERTLLATSYWRFPTLRARHRHIGIGLNADGTDRERHSKRDPFPRHRCIQRVLIRLRPTTGSVSDRSECLAKYRNGQEV